MANLLEKSSILITPTAYSDGKIHSAKPIQSLGGLDASLDFTRGSSATRVNADGLIESSQGINTPRINYKDGVGSLLLEPQSTNLITQSEAFDNVYWSKSGATVTSGFYAPSVDSPLGSFKLVEDMGNGIHTIDKFATANLGSSEFTLSLIVKKENRSKISLSIIPNIPNDFSNNATVSFDLETGLAISSTRAVSNISNLGNGWFRVSVTSTQITSSSSTHIQPVINLLNEAGSATYTGDGASGLYIFGAQLEEQSYATSYIPTTGTAQTRTADSASKTGISSLINSSEGVFYTNIKMPSSIVQNNWLTISDGTNQNSIGIVFESNEKTTTRVDVGGATQFYQTHISDYSIYQKVAISWKLNEFKMFLNGVQIGSTDTGGLVPSFGSLSQLQFAYSANGSNFTFSECRTVAVFPSLTDEELTCLTTI